MQCAERKRLFESAPAKFVKLVSMIAVARIAGAAAVGAALPMTSISSGVINEILKLSTVLGTGAVGSFLIDSLKVGWTLKAYFDGLRRLSRRA
jgi:hypothetical protein